jgi:peptidyl-dipeptidase Dcp
MEKNPRPVNNPLLDPPILPHGVPAFDQIKAEHFLPALRYALAEVKERIEAIKTDEAFPNFENTIEALERVDAHVLRITAIFGELTASKKTPDLKAIEDEMNELSVAFNSDITLDPVLFERVKAARATTDLGPEEITLTQETYKGFVRNGALLDVTGKNSLREIDEKLSQMTTQFGNNVMASAASWQKIIEDESYLNGIPSRAKDIYRDLAEQAGHPGKWLIPLDPPPQDITIYAENRALREEIFRALSNIACTGEHDNNGIVLEIVRLRHEKAQLLGYDTYAAYVLDDRMAKTPETVMAFLERNQQIYKPAAEMELQRLKTYAEEKDGLQDFQQWDYSFYARKLKEDTFKIDLEEVRSYFELDNVLRGLRIHAEKLFDIKITETEGQYPVYDNDVKVWEIHDNKSGEIIGLFYGDFYARPGLKQAGAWMNPLRGCGAEGDVKEIPISTNNLDFSKPAPGQPTLVSLGDVQTLFHEFGHALHNLLAEGKYNSLTGTNVANDFVELPSQLMENWSLQKEVLDTFATHYLTCAKIPDELINTIRRMDTFAAGYAGLRQTFFGMLDMKFHSTDPGTIRSVAELEDTIRASSTLFPRTTGPAATSFGHLFASSDGYAAGYYGYKWAEVLDADAFSAFEAKGLYDRETGDRLRASIYAKGGTEPPENLFREMMGRDPNPAALFRREGLALPSKDATQPAPPAPKAP